MKRLLLPIILVGLLAGCVSNRTFEAERERIGRLEYQQWQDVDDLKRLQSEYETNYKDIDSLMLTLEDHLSLLREELSSMNEGIYEIRNELADYSERNDEVLVSALDRLRASEQRLMAIDSSMEALRQESARQQQEMSELLAEYEASEQFSDDVIADFDRRLENMQSTLQARNSAEVPAGTSPEVESLMASINHLVSRIDELQQMIRDTNTATQNSVDVQIAANRAETTTQLNQMNNRLNDLRDSLNLVIEQMNGDMGGAQRQVSGVANELVAVANDLQVMTARNNNRREPDRTSMAYANAKSYYDRGRYEEAIIKLESFLQANPGHELCPNAMYWIAESYYAGQNYPKATRAFEAVIETYPQSRKAQDAKIKLAMIHAHNGERRLAKEELQNFKATYPNYENMRLVNRLLQGLE